MLKDYLLLKNIINLGNLFKYIKNFYKIVNSNYFYLVIIQFG